MKKEIHLSILLLAAGGSTRYGSPKQLLPFRGKPLIRHLTEVALQSKASDTYVVLGAEAKKISQELSGLPVRLIVNEEWQEGIGSSLRAGVQALPKTTEAALIMLGDQPLVTSAHLNSIIEAHQSTGKPIVASAYSGTLGVPVIFARRFFPELQRLSGDTGAKQIIQNHSGEVAGIPFPDGVVDIDTPRDLQHL
ncbi:MAG TPA: nucleotidyltransferase family protein [Bacteroidota bacterium]|nr:nucleotidyltransferase family protein [Bacteroidota bacterium]